MGCKIHHLILYLHSCSDSEGLAVLLFIHLDEFFPPAFVAVCYFLHFSSNSKSCAEKAASPARRDLGNGRLAGAHLTYCFSLGASFLALNPCAKGKGLVGGCSTQMWPDPELLTCLCMTGGGILPFCAHLKKHWTMLVYACWKAKERK